MSKNLYTRTLYQFGHQPALHPGELVFVSTRSNTKTKRGEFFGKVNMKNRKVRKCADVGRQETVSDNVTPLAAVITGQGRGFFSDEMSEKDSNPQTVVSQLASGLKPVDWHTHVSKLGH